MSAAADKLATRTVGSRPLAIGIAVLLVTAGLLAVLGLVHTDRRRCCAAGWWHLPSSAPFRSAA